jgi:CDP-diacylglycerol--glycerol-3-phosphate 3-phosphatidyltransferase
MLARLPNLLTVARLVAIVPFAVLLARAGDAVSVAAAAIFAAASLTDFLDGYLARHAHAQSRFGRLADPLADRLLIDIALVLLVYHARLPWWLAVPVLLRDVLLGLLFGRRHAATRVQVNLAGKAATAAIMSSLALLMLTPRPWPLALYAAGLLLSVTAAGIYYHRDEGGLTSRPS